MAARKKAKKRPVPTGQATALPRARQPAKKAAKKVAKRPVKKVAKRPVKKTAKRPVKKTAKRPVKKVAKVAKVSQRPVKKVAKRPVKKVAKHSTKKVAKRPTKKTAKVAKTSQRPTKKVAKAAKKVAKAAKRPVATSKRPAAVKRPATAAKRPATAAKRPATAAKRPATAAKRPSAATKRPAKKVAKHKPSARFVPVTPAFVPYSPRRDRKKRGKWNAETERVRDNLRQILEFAASIVRMGGWSARVETAAYDENIVDGDLYVEIPFNRASYEEISSMTRQVNDALNNVGKMPQGYISCGWKLHPDVQDDRLDQRYKKFEGALRVGLYYQKIRLIDENFLTAVTVLENMMSAHSRPPMGFIVRIEWSEDGVLHRRR